MDTTRLRGVAAVEPDVAEHDACELPLQASGVTEVQVKYA